MAVDEPKFLPALLAALQRVHAQGQEVSTEAFAGLMDVVVRIFDHMGAVLHIAKHELVVKTSSLHQAAEMHPALSAMVAADIAAGKVTVKDSCSRNLHRLVFVITFVRVLLEQFSSSKTVSARDAARTAYEKSLAPIHVFMVRTAVWTSLYMLPTREHFMQALGETEESAAASASEIIELSKEVEQRTLALFSGINMPASTPTANLLASLMGRKPAEPAATTVTAATTTTPAH